MAGILTAPKSGKETRQQIKNSGSAAIREAELRLKRLYGDLSDVLDEAKIKLASLSAKGKKELAKLVDEAKTAQRKVKMTLNAIHEGEADDPDLEEALNEAKAAKKHLVDFFKKA